MAATEAVRKVKRIFIASPGDLSEERKLFPKIVQRINKLKAHAMDVELEPLGWEDTLPGCGRPQELINQDVEQCDLFVMLLWARWGTPPAENSPYSSGTEEEYELARRLHREQGSLQILLYFRAVPEKMLADPGEQLSKVLEFRKRIEAERSLLFRHYQDPEEWQDLLMEHIARWLDGFQPVPSPTSASIPLEIQQRISELEEQLAKLAEKHKDTQSKLREVALDLGKQAAAAAGDGRLTEAEELFAKATQTYPEPWVINALGLYYMQIGSLERAEEKFRQIEQLGKEQGNKEYLAVAYGNLGVIYKTRGDLKTAEEMFRRSLLLEEELGRKEGMADEYGNLGGIYESRGNLGRAQEMVRKALKLHEELGDKEGLAADYGNLGLIYGARGDLDKAEKTHRQALALNQELGRKKGMAANYSNLGLIYQTRGDLKTAEEMHRKSLALHEELGRKEGMASDYGNLGVIYQTRDDLKTAEEMHRKSLALEEELGHKEGMASDYGNLGGVYQKRGEVEKAEEMVRKALALFKELGAKLKVKQVRRHLAEIRQQKKESQERSRKGKR